jgi:phosphohistidine phosphatase SixA
MSLRMLAALIGLFVSAPLCASAVEPTAHDVVLVRHADKAAEPAGDPRLNEQGNRRALALASALHHAGIRHIVVSQYRRTGETAAPLAAALDIVPQVVPPGDGIEAHVRDVVAAVRGATGPVLVVGHSNTVPAIITALGGPQVAAIDEDEYDRLYLLSTSHGSPRLVQGRYGD